MINPADAKDILSQTGIVIKKVAEKTNIRYSYLSEWINGKRNFTYDEMARLDTYFDKLKQIM